LQPEETWSESIVDLDSEQKQADERGDQVIQVVSSELIERRKFLKRFRKVHNNRRKINEGRRREEEKGTTVKSNCGGNESIRRGGFHLKVWVHCRG
jgi:hypothetical protein